MNPLFKRVEEKPSDLAQTVRNWLTHPGRRFGHLTARRCDDGSFAIDVLLLDRNIRGGLIISAPLAENELQYTSLTPETPAAHWAERAVGDLFGIQAVDHPRWKSLILHSDAWPEAPAPLSSLERLHKEPYSFLEVSGEGVHEIPVGPIHAGIIEPGHFRFSCVGEIISNLDIRLGYQHRGVEKRLTELPWQQTHYLAESASSDTAAGNALAHAVAMEDILGIQPPPRAQAFRSVALELERLANHIGDLGAISGDIGYSACAALFPPMRGAVLALAQLLTGTRRQRYYIKPGGVARDLDDSRRADLVQGLADISKRMQELIPLILENPAAVERMEGTGRLSPGLARDFGIVGPAARASGSHYDARTVFAHGVYPGHAPKLANRSTGDALARAQIRADEIHASLEFLTELLSDLPKGAIFTDCNQEKLPSDAVGLGIVEAWRGELIHWVTTNGTGAISRYSIKDPSFNNWTGLAIAVRGNLVADFPLCNKSFNLSYSGNDL